MPRYRSKAKELKINMKSSYVKEVEGRRVVVPGHKIVFHNNFYETEDPKEIEFLDKDPGCVRMQGRGVFIKINEDAVEEAIEKTETTEERRERLERELKELKKKEKEDLKKTVKPKEKGTRKKVGKKNEKPKF